MGQGSTDFLFIRSKERMLKLEQSRIDTPNSHGTGCTLSSAIAAFTAQGLSLEEAVGQSESYLHSAIVAGSAYHIGRGHGPVHHFHTFWS